MGRLSASLNFPEIIRAKSIKYQTAKVVKGIPLANVFMPQMLNNTDMSSPRINKKSITNALLVFPT
jgi:hypothetical protein